MEIASISIGTGLDLSGVMRDLKRFGSSQANTAIKIKATVDDRQLTDLGKHLKETVQLFKSNVIRPLVDDRALTALNKTLDATTSKIRSLVVEAKELKSLGNIRIGAVSGGASRSNVAGAKSAGRAISDGLIDGIKSGSSSVAQASGFMADVVIKSTKKKLGIRSPSRVFQGFGQLVSKGFELGLHGFSDADDFIDEFLKNAEKKFGAAQGSFAKLSGALKLSSAFFGIQALEGIVTGITNAGQQALMAGLEFEKFERQLNFVTGSASKTQDTLKGLSAEAKALGGNFKSAIAGQAQLAAATKGTSLEGAATDQIGSAARQASAVFGLNVEEADRVNRALAQMASKGKVSAEELRQQLGDVLPGAFQIFARSIGVTSTQLDDMLQRGEVGTDAMVKFASQLKSETSTGVAGAANSAQASMNRFNNEIYAMQVSFGKALLPVQSFGLGALTVALQALGVILPVVAAAAIGFGTKALLGMGINAITAGVGIGALSKGLLMLPGTMLKAAVAFAPLAAQALIFVAIADGLKMLSMQFSETEGATKDFAKSSVDGLKEYLRIIGEATDKTDLLKQSVESLPKSYAEDTMIGGAITGMFGDAGTKYLREAEVLQGRSTKFQGSPFDRSFWNNEGADASNPNFVTRQQKEGRDILAQSKAAAPANDRIMADMTKALKEFSQGGGKLQEMRAADVQMRDLQAKRGMLGSGDDAGRAEIDKQYQAMTKEREQLAAEVNALPAQIKRAVEGYKASNKQIEALMSQGNLNPSDLKQLQSQLNINNAKIAEGEKGLQGYAKAINTAISGAARLESQLQAINTTSEFRSNQNALGSAQRQGAIAIAQTNGQLTPGQAQSASNLSDQATQIQSIETLNATMLQLNNLLQSPATSRAFGISGLSSGSNSSEIGQYIADFSGDRDSEEFKILQQAQTQKAQLEQLQTQSAQASTQLAESQQQAQESIKQTTREISDFVKGIGESIAEIGRTIEAQDLDTQIQNTKNDIQRNLSGFSDRFFGDFIGGLDEMIDLIHEPLRRMTEAKGTIAGMNQQLAQTGRQGSDLIRNSASGGNGFVPGMGGSALGGSVAELALGREGTEFREGVAAQCANFVRDVFSQAGIELGVTNAPVDGIATSAGFANSLFGRDIGEIITDPLKLVAGDIVGFRNTYQGDWGADAITHTGIYTGNGMMIDRSTSSAPVRHRPLDTFDMTGFVAVRPNAFAAAGGNVGNASTPPATSMSASSAAIGAGNYGGVTLNEEQVRNAAIIAKVGRDLGVSPRDIQIAIATAMQESSLVNLTGGDRDSVGLFQQRSSMDWGTNAQIMNPEHSARSFFQGAGTNPGLLDIQNRGSMSVTQAAQATQRSGHPDAYAKWEGMSAELAGRLSGGGAGGTAINTPGANTSAIDPALTQYGAAIAQQTDSIMSRMEAQNEGSTIALRQRMQASRQKLEEAQRTLIDETRQYNERYQDSILAAFGDSPIASALQQLTTDSRDVESTTRAMSLTINDATNSLDNLKATRQTILDDPSLAPLKELVPGMDAAIAQYESQIDQIGVARDREQRILSDRRNAIIENLEATGREQLKALSQQTEDLQIQQQAGLVKDPQLAAMLQGRSQRMEVSRSFESESGAIVSEIAKISGGIERLKSEALAAGSVIDPLQLEVATGQLDNLKDRLDALSVNRDLKLQLIDVEQIELLRQFNKESEQALTGAQLESLNTQGDVFGANQLQFLQGKLELVSELQTRLTSINQLEQQQLGTAGFDPSVFTKMREEAISLSEVSFQNLAQQFPDLAQTINDTAFQAFQGLGSSISSLVMGTGSLEDAFDSFSSTVINQLVNMGLQWASSELFSSFQGSGRSGGGGIMEAILGGGTGRSGGDTIGSILSTGVSLFGSLGGFDNGGMIPGRFSGKPDQHIARVNPGEYIMQRSSVQKYGSATMRSINMGSFDKGGMVGSDRATYKDYSSKSESGGSREPIKVEYEVTRINEQNFVTEEQLRRSLTATSQETEKRMNRSMRNSPSYRGGIGI